MNSYSFPETPSRKRPVHPRFQKYARHLKHWALPAVGAVALMWFVMRVLPKPSRASYPCMRASFPLASGFVVWLASLLGMRLAWKHFVGNLRSRRLAYAAMAGVCGLAASLAWIATMPGTPVMAASPDDDHGAIGEGKGVFPGRVVWVHAPEATEWPGEQSGIRWSDADCSHEPTINRMMAEAVMELGGGTSVASAWDAMFREFNARRYGEEQGYQPGEKFMIKINLTLNNATMGALDANYNKVKSGWLSGIWNNIEIAPQAILALLRQLVYEVGVEESDISIGDPVCLVPNYLWNMIHPEFPNVKFIENTGLQGRQRVEFSGVPFSWSHPDAAGKRQDYLPEPYAEARYLVNFAIPKSHALGGITATAKNHYGSFIRTPIGHLRGEGDEDFFNLHYVLPGDDNGTPGMGEYRPLVDIMGHEHLGGKTILYILDGLFAGHGWEGDPEQWQMEPFNGDWPSSVFMSMDPVAIDSVAYDFLVAEWPEEVLDSKFGVGGAQDYLHEAAQADRAPSRTRYDPEGDGSRLESLGVHEHWNNPIDKQYSRNLGLDEGIELVQLYIDGAEPQKPLELTAKPEGAESILLRAVHTDPNARYVLEQLNLSTGQGAAIRNLTGGSYGERIERTLGGGNGLFLRVRQD